MGGQNPFIEPVSAQLPKKPYSITFLPMNVKIDVKPEELPYSRHGEKGSILEIALGHDLEIDHACGGVCACSTCHVIVRQGHDTLSKATDDEEDMLDSAPGLTPTSRLACQAVPNGTKDVVVEIPRWNRNHAKEDH